MGERDDRKREKKDKKTRRSRRKKRSERSEKRTSTQTVRNGNVNREKVYRVRGSLMNVKSIMKENPTSKNVRQRRLTGWIYMSARNGRKNNGSDGNGNGRSVNVWSKNLKMNLPKNLCGKPVSRKKNLRGRIMSKRTKNQCMVQKNMKKPRKLIVLSLSSLLSLGS